MYDQIRENALFIILYTAVTVMAAIASCYLLLRRGNAFAADVTPPLRLRRWASAFLAFVALGHIWYMSIFFLSSEEDIVLFDMLGGLIDCMTFFPLSIVIMLTMLQDRRRPLWPVAVAFAPPVVINAYDVATRNYDFLVVEYVYFLLLCIGLIVYMVYAVQQYGRWLRDNYADLEHKEVWQSFVVLAVIMLTYVFYAMTIKGTVYIYALLAISAALIGYLLWRVETLSDLSIKSPDDLQMDDSQMDDSQIDELQIEGDDSDSSAIQTDETPSSDRNRSTLAAVQAKNIGPLLKQYCEEPQLYLQYDLTLVELAKAVGTNRSYLSKHFALQGITYNAYINGLRIKHFVNLYHEAVATQQPVTAQQLAYQSGFHSYTTFSIAFKKIMGMNTTEWMRETLNTNTER